MLDQVIRADPPLRTELRREPHWRCYGAGDATPERNIVASRWADERSSLRREQASAPEDRYVLSVALRSTKLRFTRGALTLAEGRMPAGMIHVTGPAQKLEAEFHEPCDFVHLYVAEKYVAQCAAQLPGPVADLADLLVRDPVAGHLGRTLAETHAAGGRAYEETVGQTIITRLLMTRRSAPTVNPLPKWRLRRVHEFVQASIGEHITLRDLAATANLSRMHFAAQFRAATGCRPHDYLLQQRVECAKAVMSSDTMPLAEVALSVGFQTQSHFSTVFKRITGDTPGQWRRSHVARIAVESRPARARSPELRAD
jgi:AraC-like DNA-binding protein